MALSQAPLKYLLLGKNSAKKYRPSQAFSPWYGTWSTFHNHSVTFCWDFLKNVFLPQRFNKILLCDNRILSQKINCWNEPFPSLPIWSSLCLLKDKPARFPSSLWVVTRNLAMNYIRLSSLLFKKVRNVR